MSERDSKCFIPECNRTVGVLFPKNTEVKNKWLRDLGLEHCMPTSKSFVCLKHFGPDGQPARGTKKNDFPEVSPRVLKKNTSVELLDPKKLEILKKKSWPNVRINRVNQYKENVGSESDDIPEKYHRVHGRKCRLCLTTSQLSMNSVFDKLNKSVTISQAVTVCLVPLQISANDKLSKYICLNCTDLLKTYYEFHTKCFENDQKQRSEIRNVIHHKSENDADSEHSDDDRLNDFERKYNKDFYHNKSVKNNMQTNEDLIKVLEGNDEVVLTKVKKPPPPVSSHDEVSHEEESQNEGDDVTEDIIIEMFEDSELPDATSPLVPVDLPENISIMKVENGAKKPEKRKRSELSETSDNENAKKTKFILPKSDEGKMCKKFEDQKPYTSPLGTYKSSEIKYISDYKFILANNYLYKVGLTLDHNRHLCCLKMKCPGEAVQKVVTSNQHAEQITVTVGHNHPEPDEAERKVELFYHLLYKNMKKQKHFNFKTHYDQMVKLDQDLLHLLPIREVVREICRQGPLNNAPKIQTFNDLYAYIESENCSNLQFTDDAIQFYQAKFEAEDGSKGLLFANEATIASHSSGKVMYVDSTFLIKTEGFPIHLITVLMMHDSVYYPVCYAIVSKHSQELYRKIFSYLYNNLAPKLRPEEIVTEYEANIYYALGETYNNDSVIGGSVYSYTQNLYKYICSLGLARQLELNTYFRTIFDLLVALPLMPMNFISDALKDIKDQAKVLPYGEKVIDLFNYVKREWVEKVSPDLFCVHRLTHRLSENLMPPFKRLRDTIVHALNSKKTSESTIDLVISKLMEVDKYFSQAHRFTSETVEHRTSTWQKNSVVKAWDFIDSHPTTNVNRFLESVQSYVKSLENQLWVWGLYKYGNPYNEMLIDRKNFLMDEEEPEDKKLQEKQDTHIQNDHEYAEESDKKSDQIIVEANEEHPQEETEEQEETETIEEYYLDDSGKITKIDQKKSNSELLAEFGDDIDHEVDETLKEENLTEEDLAEDAEVVELFEDSNGECYIIENGVKKMVSQVEGDDTISYMYE